MVLAGSTEAPWRDAARDASYARRQKARSQRDLGQVSREVDHTGGASSGKRLRPRRVAHGRQSERRARGKLHAAALAHAQQEFVVDLRPSHASRNNGTRR